MTLVRALTPHEIEACEAMTARRDAAVRLRDVLDADIARYDEGMEMVGAGRSMDILVPTAAGQVRRAMSDAIGEFEAARHRFRLAMVVVAMDNGMNAREIGDAYAFSRQLASRYLREARAKWPDLEEHDHELVVGSGWAGACPG